MSKQKSNLSENIRSYLIITIGLFIGAIAWTGFIIPAGIVGSGVSGIATMIYFVSGIKVGYSVFLINTVFLLVSLRILGFSFGIKTLYGITVISFSFGYFNPLLLNLWFQIDLCAQL